MELETITLGGLMDAPMTPREWLLEPWLREQESALIWAAPGVGKTMLTLSLALAVAGGGEILGWKAPKPRKVLFIDGEMPLDDLQGRLTYLARAVEGLDVEAARQNLVILARHQQRHDTPFPDFGDDAQFDDIIELILSYGPDLVVLDNLSTLATFGDENAAADAQKVVKLLARLKQAKVGVIVVHHSGKAGKSFRGSSMLATTFEVILGLTKDPEDALLYPGAARFQLEWSKFRHKRDATIGDRVVTLSEVDEYPQWRVHIPENETLAALAALVRTGRYKTQVEVGAALPPHLWPTPDSPPSTGWVSKKLDLADLRGVISRSEVKRMLRAARSEEGDGVAIAA